MGVLCGNDASTASRRCGLVTTPSSSSRSFQAPSHSRESRTAKGRPGPAAPAPSGRLILPPGSGRGRSLLHGRFSAIKHRYLIDPEVESTTLRHEDLLQHSGLPPAARRRRGSRRPSLMRCQPRRSGWCPNHPLARFVVLSLPVASRRALVTRWRRRSATRRAACWCGRRCAATAMRGPRRCARDVYGESDVPSSCAMLDRARAAAFSPKCVVIKCDPRFSSVLPLAHVVPS